MVFNNQADQMNLITNGSIIYQAKGKSNIAFENLTINTNKNTTLCLVGSNGCGKSSTLNVLNGIQNLSGGKKNFSIKSSDCLGILLQDYRSQLLPWASVKTNLLLPINGGHKLEITEEEIIDFIVSFCGQVGFNLSLEDRAGKLSGGEQQMIVLARSLAYKPKYLLWDEPLSAIDVSKKFKIYDFLLEYWILQETTVIFATHDIDEAILLSDRILIFGKKMNILLEERIEKENNNLNVWERISTKTHVEIRNKIQRTLMKV